MLRAQLPEATRPLSAGITSMPQVELASAEDLPAIRALLDSAGLPTSDLVSARPRFMVIREQGRLVAAGALERCANSALLRSVVVSLERRGCGLGQAVVRELERMARSAEIECLVVLTQTAKPFFERCGYRLIERQEAPREVQSTQEFRSLCPSSASCMLKVLRALT